MTNLIEIPFKSSTMLVEVSSRKSDLQPIGRSKRPVEKIEGSFEDAIMMVSRLAETMEKTMQDAGASSAEVSLGFKFTAAGKLFLVETSGEGSLNLKLQFSRRN